MSSGSADRGVRSQHIRRFSGENRGATAIEFMMVCPLLLILMFGMTGLGQALFSVASIQWAVERSVRALMIDGSLTQTDLEQRVRDSLRDITDIELQIHYTEDDSHGIPLVRVYTDVSYLVDVPLVPEFSIVYRVDTYVPRPFKAQTPPS